MKHLPTDIDPQSELALDSPKLLDYLGLRETCSAFPGDVHKALSRAIGLRTTLQNILAEEREGAQKCHVESGGAAPDESTL